MDAKPHPRTIAQPDAGRVGEPPAEVRLGDLTERMRDRRMLDLAARAGWRGFGKVEPNPMVGCAIVHHGADGSPLVVGLGHHKRFGDLHAERDALEDCARRSGPGAARGATAYVTLEPCNGHGKQPPCVEALVAAGVKEVVYAEADPSRLKGGGAIELERRGIAARRSDASPLASRLSAPWRKHLATGLPWVIVKWAQTIDGRVATATGDSKWISAEPSRRLVHALRGRVDLVLTGVGTVLADDPMLDCRFGHARRHAMRIVVDSHLQTPIESRLIQSAASQAAGRVILACASEVAGTDPARLVALRELGVGIWSSPGVQDAQGAGLDPSSVNIAALLKWLAAPTSAVPPSDAGERPGGGGVQTVLVEAGPRLVGSLLRLGLVDEVVTFTAPFAMPDSAARSASQSRAEMPTIDSIAAGREGSTFRTGLIRPVRGCDDVLCTWWRPPNR